MIYQVTENVTKTFVRDIDDDGRTRDIEAISKYNP